MADVKKYSLVEKLREADNTLMGSPSLMGITMLTYPNYINSMRSTMFTSHSKQFLNLLHPQIPFVFTNNEKLAGKYSSGYLAVKNETEVYKKVVKFKNLVDTPRTYVLFVFDKKRKKFEMIKRQVCENLTENFGYDYCNDVIDSFNEGDTIPPDTTLYHSTSYDEDMNYGYGRNVTVAYTLEPFTSEDAAICSETLSKLMSSIETETVKINLKCNDYFVNLYGDNEHYKPLPEIGQKVSDILAVIRKHFTNQMLSDFKTSSLQHISDSDQIYYCEKDIEIVDITIYDNSDERNDSPFYNQINEILDAQNEYWEEILNTCEEIINSGYEYSGDIDYTYKRAKEMLNTEKKWRSGDDNFSNMCIEIQTRRETPLTKACKITG